MVDAASLWDQEAATFDDEPDHGLLDVDVRQAWRELLVEVLPPAPARVVDVGCGTGTLAVLLAEEGLAVTGIDVSGQMLARARSKAAAASLPVALVRGDAADPPLRSGTFDVVVCRHVLWAMHDVDAALASWSDLLGPDGVLVLVEGRWSTGAGLPSTDVVAAMRRLGRRAVVRPLTDERLWGRRIDDDRYLVVGSSPAAPFSVRKPTRTRSVLAPRTGSGAPTAG
jgi:ubiquinone/menaquinone biosynthesis C-methylase UbiE